MADLSFRLFAMQIAFTLISVPAWAEQRVHEGILETPSGHSIFYSYKVPLNGSPNLVLLNGLDHDVDSWNDTVENLERANDGIGILRYDMRGMGKSLQDEMMKSILSLRGFNSLPAIPYEQQTEDLNWLINYLKLRGDIYLVGLSYGAAIALDFMAKHPEAIKQAILASPYLAPLPQQDSIIKQEIALVRQTPTHPLNVLSDDRLYDLFLIPMVAIYPIFEPPLIRKPWKISGVYRMVQGARDFDALTTSRLLRPKSIHVMWAEKDQYLARDQVINFHRHAPPSIFASETILKDIHHDMVRQVPKFLATFALKVLSGHPITDGERRITAYPHDGYAETEWGGWRFEADSKPLVDQIYLSRFETFFSPITWNLLDGSGDDCTHLLEKH